MALLLGIQVSGLGFVYAGLYPERGFGVSRAYFTLKGGESWGGRLTLDAAAEADSEGHLIPRLKYAYLFGEGRWGRLELGLVHDVWIGWEEGVWGFRFVDKVPAGRWGFSHSADFGALWRFEAGSFRFAAGAYDGLGYKRLAADRIRKLGLAAWGFELVGAAAWVPLDEPDSFSAVGLLYKKTETWAVGLGGGASKGERLLYSWARLNLGPAEVLGKAEISESSKRALLSIAKSLSSGVKLALAGFYEGGSLGAELRGFLSVK